MPFSLRYPSRTSSDLALYPGLGRGFSFSLDCSPVLCFLPHPPQRSQQIAIGALMAVSVSPLQA